MSLVGRLFGRGTQLRNLQERADVYRAVLLFEFRSELERMRSTSSDLFSRDRLRDVHIRESIAESVESRLQSTNFHEHLRLLQQSVSRRLHPWFEEILPQVRQQDSHQDQEDTKRDLYLPGSIKQAQEEANLQKRRNQRMSMERELMLSRYGFSLGVSDSYIPGGGKGLFLSKGSCEIGDILGVCPGVVYRPWELRNIGFSGDDIRDLFVSIRYDRYGIDSFPCRVTSSEKGLVSEDPRFQLHNMALAHMINHPPRGVEPNVLSIGIYLNSKWCQDDNKILEWASVKENLQNWIAKSASSFTGDDIERRRASLSDADSADVSNMEVWIPTLAMIALRPILKGEEIYLDYRLNPNAKTRLPPWYWPVDTETLSRRWAS